MKILKTMDNLSISINEDEETKILQAISSGNKHIIVRGALITVSGISGIYPEELVKSQNEGVLHDGGRVIKKFGTWVMADNPDVKIDPAYYPEVAKDCVPTPEQFKEKYQQLPVNERLQLIQAEKEPLKLNSKNDSNAPNFAPKS